MSATMFFYIIGKLTFSVAFSILFLMFLSIALHQTKPDNRWFHYYVVMTDEVKDEGEVSVTKKVTIEATWRSKLLFILCVVVLFAL